MAQELYEAWASEGFGQSTMERTAGQQAGPVADRIR